MDPQSSYPYSPPPARGRAVLADMVLWYSSPDLRQELLDPDSDLVSTLIDEVLENLESWRPTTELHYSYFRAGRVVDWIVWSTVSAADPSMVATYSDPDENLEPWAVKIDTLPAYPGLPTAIIKAPAPPTELDLMLTGAWPARSVFDGEPDDPQEQVETPEQ